ncbi:hypothetical protein [Actinocrinis sp.]|uniref:hypothetical protein n=1 Tax=Actinocrinis sp. TaxID=1920516 RepID=UPI002D2313A7|nr:hypothetical protein [Actinocrinis sp.]HZP55112.1 hypothetical protein [Actinocrinis sp.]
MSGILQGALGGSRALLLGWFLPSAINILLYGALVDPRHSGFDALSGGSGDAARPALYALTGTLVLGLLLASLQTQLYRLLEGYLAWPDSLFRAVVRRHLSRKHLLQNRLQAAMLVQAEAAGPLSAEYAAALAASRAHPVTGRYVDRDARRGPVWLAILEERLNRYPVDDRQFAATRLGNAIRRLEEYGYDRFRLDTQVVWHELIAVAPEQARKQAEDSRTGVDFFVCLLYGHLLVAAAAFLRLGFGSPHPAWKLWALAGVLLALIPVWYRTAVVATDDWTGSVKALVDLGRKPLAEALGLELPGSLAAERSMWTLAGGLTSSPYSEQAGQLDPFRAPATRDGGKADAATEAGADAGSEDGAEAEVAIEARGEGVTEAATPS